jgi:hypothetical protein
MALNLTFVTKRLFRVLISLVFLTTTSCSNIFESSSKQDSDEAIFENAKKNVDAQNWDAALSDFASLSASFAARKEVVEYWASAHAGKCGLNFVDFFTTLGSLGSDALFKTLMNSFTNVNVSPYHCYLAQLKMEEIGPTPSTRSVSQNLFMLILGLTRIGTYLRASADQDNDDNMDGTFNACVAGAYGSTVADRVAAGLDDKLSNEEVKMIVTGLGLLITSLTGAVESLIGGGLGNTVDDLVAACDNLSPGACNITDPTDTATLTAGFITNFRYVLHTSTLNPTINIGAGNCNDPVITNCCTP